jgi:anti-sigma B factor antagonist
VQSRPSASDAEVWVVIPEGRLDASAAPDLERVLAGLEGQGVTRLVLNFCLTHYISSSSLRVMILHTRRLRQAGGGLTVCCMPDKVAKVLCIAGLNAFFQTFPCEEDAVQAFSSIRPAPGADASGHGR